MGCAGAVWNVQLRCLHADEACLQEAFSSIKHLKAGAPAARYSRLKQHSKQQALPAPFLPQNVTLTLCQSHISPAPHTASITIRAGYYACDLEIPSIPLTFTVHLQAQTWLALQVPASPRL